MLLNHTKTIAKAGEQKAEVIKMSIFEYDEEREIELIRRDEREIGEKLGIEKERQNTQKERENAIQSIISVYKETKSSPDQAIQKLMQLYQSSLGNTMHKG